MTTAQDDYAELQHWLLNAERERIAKLEQRLDSFPLRSREVAALLPSALNQSPDIDALAEALKAPVANSILQSFNETPQRFAKPLLPTLAPPLQKPLQNRLNQLEREQLSPLVERMTRLETVLPRFDSLVQQLNNAEQRVSEMADFLPKAIRQASQGIGENAQKSETDLTDSLKEPVQRCLRQSISEDTQVLADTLFPVMGPAIRKSINETFKGFLQELNTRVQQSPFSPKGIAWRWEAWRTGSSLQEVILRETLMFRVEQVFLIHRDSGLLIHHLHQEDIEIGDSDAVSAMLTAIQDFIHDSFSGTGDAQLERVEIGEFTVWLERGPHAVLACVIRGNAPYSYKDVMHDALETMHARYGLRLEQFDGDNTQLLPVLTLLQKVLVSESRAPSERLFTPAIWVSLTVVLLLIFAGIGGLIYYNYQLQQHEAKLMAYVSTLQQTPGLVPVNAEYRDRQLYLHGLRDPLAADPKQLAVQANIMPAELIAHWTPYQDLSPSFVEQRLQQQLALPATVQMQLQDDVLYLKGHADQQWIAQAYERAARTAGVSRVVSADLTDTDAYWQQTAAQFETLLQRLHAAQGIIVTSHERVNGQRIIRGLRDPLAIEPQQLAVDIGLDNVVMQWQPYQDLSPNFVLQRARSVLRPPNDIQLNITENNTVQVSGQADSRWLNQAPQWASTVAGVNALDLTETTATDSYWLNTADTFAQFIEALHSTPGLVVTASGQRGEKRFVRGLRDPLAADPRLIAEKMQIEWLDMNWQPYQDLSSSFVLRRAQMWLQPPPSVELLLKESVLILNGQADSKWIARAYDSVGKLTGITALNTEQLRNTDADWQATEPAFKRLLETLNNTPGLVVTASGRQDQHWYVQGLRDPLAPDPTLLAAQAGLAQIQMRWQYYQELSPSFVLQRAKAWLQPPPTLELTLAETILSARGTADSAWLEQAQASIGKLPGVSQLDSTAVTLEDRYWLETEADFQQLIQTLDNTPGLLVTASGRRDEQRFIHGLRDPLAPDPASIVAQYPLQRLTQHWQAYQDLSPDFVLQRARAWLQPPASVRLHLTENVLHLQGETTSTWLEQARASVGKIAGITAFDFTALNNTDAVWQTAQPRFNALVQTLQNTAGITVLDNGWRGDHWWIQGLRDPLAVFPSQAVTAADLSDLKQSWQPYQDLSPAFMQTRLQQQLALPDTVQLKVDAAGGVQLSGEAQGDWIRQAVQIAQQQAGVQHVDSTALIDLSAGRDQLRPLFAAFLAEVSVTPGLVVTHTQEQANGGWLVQGLRDPLAPDPAQLAARYLLSEVLELHWRPYQDLSPAFVLQHAQQRLQPPETVELSLTDAQVLQVSGEASAQWIQQLNNALGLPVRLDTRNLVNIDLQRWQTAKAQLNQLNILFNESTNMQARQLDKLQQAADSLRTLIDTATVLGYQVRIEIIGDTDGLGSYQHNQQLAQTRADFVTNWLVNRGIAQHYLQPRVAEKVRFGGEVANYPYRRVSFRILE